MAREKIKKLPQLTADQMARYKKEIEHLAAQDVPVEALREQYREYLPDKPLGRAICMAYRKEELTAVLAACAGRLGHAPAMHEVFPLYRWYIKQRFGTWPKAIRESGLRYGLNECGPNVDWSPILSCEPEIGVLLVKLSERQRTLGYPPVKKEAQGGNLLKQRFCNWNDVLAGAKELDTWLEAHPTHLAPQAPEDQAALKRLAEDLGRTPLLEEASEELRISLRLGWGSWRTALDAAGLPALDETARRRAEWEHQQRKHAGSCDLRLVREPTARQKSLLDRLEALCRELDRAPLREELPQELRTELAESFGSLRNALFQLGRPPLSGQERQKLRAARRKALKN